MKTSEFNTQYPSTQYLRQKAKKRIPKFAFEYLDGGCNEEINLWKNISDIQNIEFIPKYITQKKSVDLSCRLFDETYEAPFGIAPVGLQGLIWPKSCQILAHAAHHHNIPFVLSTVSTSDIETISKITQGKAWFQLYHPAEQKVTDDILHRAQIAGIKTLVLLSDVPSFGLRYKDIKNGLSMRPKMSFNNFIQILKSPSWAWNTLMKGKPNFDLLKPYMPPHLSLKRLGEYMNNTFDGKLTPEKIRRIRNQWKGNLIVKGIASEHDIEKCIELGVDGVIVSNHGGRQIDAGESSFHSMLRLIRKYKNEVPIMMDGGIRSGVDIARVLACGASYVFMGRPFMYGVGALGKNGGNHTISMFKGQLEQVMDQLGCHQVEHLSEFLKQDG
ncbi:MAG: alpha-hydroxy acid oxidase [Flavobacteriaceae bacterium]|nr:alpha-hydroxy acid oxidase [Flavobacteriaceae bacterium]